MSNESKELVAGASSMKSAIDSPDLSRNELAAKAVRTLGKLRLRATGSSMLPSIRAGDLLTIHSCDIEEANAGDVVLFLRHRRLFVHRVVSSTFSQIVTQGDAHSDPDPAIGSSELLGKVVHVERSGNPAHSAFKPTLPGRLTTALIRRSPRFTRLLIRLHNLQARAGL